MEPLPSWGNLLRGCEDFGAIVRQSMAAHSALAVGHHGNLFSAHSTFHGGTCVMWPSLRPVICCWLQNFAVSSHAQAPAELHCLSAWRAQNLQSPAVDDEASENIRYLTGGVLIRVNRQTQALEPGLAESWRVSPDGRQITFPVAKGYLLLRRFSVLVGGRGIHDALADGSAKRIPQPATRSVQARAQ